MSSTHPLLYRGLNLRWNVSEQHMEIRAFGEPTKLLATAPNMRMAVEVANGIADKREAPPDRLTPERRADIITELAQHRLANMFGDGMELEYVLEGFPALKGLHLMTDDELLEEQAQVDNDVDEEL
jgi:hypothetical protein